MRLSNLVIFQAPNNSWWHFRSTLDRRYWWASAPALVNTLERDGPILYEDKHWRSRTAKLISYPWAIMDDFGALVPVER